MEADSTTYDKSTTDSENESGMPFSTGPSNYRLYKEFIENNSDRNFNIHIVEKMQEYGLIPETISCPTNNPDCVIIKKAARVVDRVQWVCGGCGKRQPIRTNSFFFRLQCSLLQALQIILAWCEDADVVVAAEFFGVKLNMATLIYDKLDDLAVIKQHNNLLGGDDTVVLAELYPDCLNRLSPDTTDQPHIHRILMMADTMHIPTRYRLTVIKDPKKQNELDEQTLKSEVDQIISKCTLPNSVVIAGNSLQAEEGTTSIQQLFQHCDLDMQRFLTSRIWSQAVILCGASRDLCAGVTTPSIACASAVQSYLNSALYRLQYNDAFFEHMLKIIAREFTETNVETT